MKFSYEGSDGVCAPPPLPWGPTFSLSRPEGGGEGEDDDEEVEEEEIEEVKEGFLSWRSFR